MAEVIGGTRSGLATHEREKSDIVRLLAWDYFKRKNLEGKLGGEYADSARYPNRREKQS